MPRHRQEKDEFSSAPNDICKYNAPKQSARRLVGSASKNKKVNRYCAANSKLDELKLAFRLLSRNIQGLDDEEADVKDKSSYRKVVSTSGHNEREGGEETSSDREGRDSEISVTNSTTNGKVPANAAMLTLLRQALPTAGATEIAPVGCADRRCGEGKGASATTEEADGTICTAANCFSPVVENFMSMKARAMSCGQLERCTSDHERSTAAACTEDRNATEAAARSVSRRIRRLQEELEGERGSRVATESALQEAQLQAAEATLECERLTRVVESISGHSVGGLGVSSERVERRVREAECALAESQQLAGAKAREALEALEQAADLSGALETERAARAVTEDARRDLTQKLRACLRGRAKAEEEASAAKVALKKSEAQKESLSQRLEILRATNKRLDKRATGPSAATTGVGVGTRAGTGTAFSCNGGDAAMDTRDRLAAARARIRALPARNSDSYGGEGFSYKRHGDDRAAIDRAVKAALTEKRWKEKIHVVKMKGEAHKCAARSAETGMQRVVREKAGLEEVNRMLTEKVGGLLDKERGKGNRSDEGRRNTAPRMSLAGPCGRASSAGVQQGGSLVVAGEIDTCALLPASQAGSCGNNARKGPCSTGIPTLVSPPAHDPWHCFKTDDTVAAVTRALIAHSGYEQTAGVLGASTSPTVIRKGPEGIPASGLQHTSATPWDPNRQTARSRSVAASGSISPPLDYCCGHSVIRPRSDSEPFLSDRCDPPPRACKQQQQSAPNSDSFSHALYSQLLSESRKLREEVLLAVREGPWRNGGKAKQAGDGSGSARSSPESHVNPSDDRNRDDPPFAAVVSDATAVVSVPIDVLVRLCDRSARGGKSVEGGQGAAENSGEMRRQIAIKAVVQGTHEGEDRVTNGLSNTSWAEPVEGMELAAGISVLPPGISVDLAQQVQGAVSRGDERGFLQIIGQCGSTARGGIAQLLSIDAPD